MLFYNNEETWWKAGTQTWQLEASQRMDMIGVCGFCEVNTEKEATVVKSMGVLSKCSRNVGPCPEVVGSR